MKKFAIVHKENGEYHSFVRIRVSTGSGRSDFLGPYYFTDKNSAIEYFNTRIPEKIRDEYEVVEIL